MDQIMNLLADWAEELPMPEAVKAFLGVESKASSPAPETLGAVDEDAIRRQVAMMNGRA